MLLTELLRPQLIKVDLEGKTKPQVIRELVDLLVQRGDVKLQHRQDVVARVLEGEEQLSSGKVRGVAIPHGVTHRVIRPMAALGIASHGVPFDTLDDKPAEVIVMLVAPRGWYPDQVQTLAGITKLLDRPLLRERILSLSDPEAIYTLLQTEECGRESA